MKSAQAGSHRREDDRDRLLRHQAVGAEDEIVEPRVSDVAFEVKPDETAALQVDRTARISPESQLINGK